MTSMRATVSFASEAQLREPLVAWLRASGFRVAREIPIFGRRADLLGASGDRIAAVELKLADWRGALRQAMAYQLVADEAWVAMPLAAAARAYRSAWRFEAEGVGLLAVDDRDRVRVPIPARRSPRLLPFAQDRVRPLFSKEATGLEAF